MGGQQVHHVEQRSPQAGKWAAPVGPWDVAITEVDGVVVIRLACDVMVIAGEGLLRRHRLKSPKMIFTESGHWLS